TWGDDPRFQEFKDAYFGDDINEDRRSQYKLDHYYEKQAKEILNVVQPWDRKRGKGVVLLGSNPLRPEPKFDRHAPPLEEIWLAKEDLWVQRELLQVVRNANDSVAGFKELPADKSKAAGPGEKRKQFRNPNWEIDLTLGKNKEGEPVLRGTLKNISHRKLS